MDGHVAVSFAGAEQPRAPVTQRPVAPSQQDGVPGSGATSAPLPLLARTEAARVTFPRGLPYT